MKEPRDPREETGMMLRQENEGDRTPEFKSARDGMILEVRGLLDEVERRQKNGEPLGRHGEIKQAAGIERATIEDPLEGPVNILTEKTNPVGAYFYHNPETGQRIMTLVEADGKVIEIGDNPLEQQLSGPEAGYEGASSTTLSFFRELPEDGQYVGTEFNANGQALLKQYNGEVHTNSALSGDFAKFELVGEVWGSVRQQVFDEA
jgi:hypothetical protein